MPYFSRTQLGVVLLLGAALFFLWAWRGHFGLSFPPPPGGTLSPVFVEVSGAVTRPGVYSFPHPPTLPEVWQQAGGLGPPPSGEEKLPSGSRLKVTKEGHYHFGHMSGPQLLTLGLALDLNKATQGDLEALPGIGPVLAQRIMAHRQTHGPFRRLEDLEQVPGIGPKKLAQIKPYLFFEEKADPD